MKFYNPRFIKQFCEENKWKIERVEIGMLEDWDCTCYTVYAHCELAKHIKWNADRVCVMGICGSTWATPVMLVTYIDGHQEYVECWVDDGKHAPADQIRWQKQFALSAAGIWKLADITDDE